MSQKKCYAGFVVGYDLKGKENKKVWKVRVDDQSEFDGQKFEVATTYVLLTKGLEVTFALGNILVCDRKFRKAIEVSARS